MALTFFPLKNYRAFSLRHFKAQPLCSAAGLRAEAAHHSWEFWTVILNLKFEIGISTCFSWAGSGRPAIGFLSFSSVRAATPGRAHAARSSVCVFVNVGLFTLKLKWLQWQCGCGFNGCVFTSELYLQLLKAQIPVRETLTVINIVALVFVSLICDYWLKLFSGFERTWHSGNSRANAGQTCQVFFLSVPYVHGWCGVSWSGCRMAGAARGPRGARGVLPWLLLISSVSGYVETDEFISDLDKPSESPCVSARLVLLLIWFYCVDEVEVLSLNLTWAFCL